MTLQHRYRIRAPRVRALERLVLSGGATQVSFYVPCLLAQSLVPFSPGFWVLKSPVKLRLCPVGPRRRQCAVRLPPSASSSVVESSQPDDGGRSATLLLVAFPLPSRSLLAGPDAAISPRTRTKNRRLVSVVRGPTENRHGGHFPGARQFRLTRCSYS